MSDKGTRRKVVYGRPPTLANCNINCFMSSDKLFDVGYIDELSWLLLWKDANISYIAI